jgi:hypothetical protein
MVRRQPAHQPDGFSAAGTVLPIALYVLVAVFTALFSFLHPFAYWDMLGYIGVIESRSTSDATKIHDVAYSAIRHLRTYDDLIGSDTASPYAPYRSDMARDSIHFTQQLPFYALKPLFVSAVASVHRMGISFPDSFAVVSVGAYALLACVVWFWLYRYFGAWQCVLFGCLLIANPAIISVSRSPVPDALSLSLIAVGMYLVLEHPQTARGPLLLLVSIWVRPDALVLVEFVFFAMLMLSIAPKHQLARPAAWRKSALAQKRVISEWLALDILGLLSYFTIQVAGKSYSWKILFYHSFVRFMPAPTDSSIAITPHIYLHTFASNAATLWGNSALGYTFFIAILAIFLHRSPCYRLVTAALLVSVVVHFALYPSDEPRFHIATEFFGSLSLIIACAAHISSGHEAVGQSIPETVETYRL